MFRQPEKTSRAKCLLRIVVAFVMMLQFLKVSYSSNQLVAQDKIAIENEDARLIEGLRNRRLYGLAEKHCRKILLTDELSPRESGTYTIELIKTQTARAITSQQTNRASIWDESFKTGPTFLASHPDHPRKFLVRVQTALSHLARGQLLRQEIAADMGSETARETALDELRTARSILSELQREIVAAIPEQRGRAIGDDELTHEELMALDNNVRYQLAIANVNRAQLYSVDDRLNRIDALNNVLKRLTEVQRATSAGQPLWWESRILQVECQRLLGQTQHAAETLKQLQNSIQSDTDDPQPVPQSLLQQQLRLAIETGDENAATETLRVAQQIVDRTPQLDLARLETVVSLAKSATGEQNQKLVSAAAIITREIEKQHGSYWGRRAELVLIGKGDPNPNVGSPAMTRDPENLNGTANGTGSATELDLMIRLADQAMRKNRFDDALKAYDRATAEAKKLGNAELAFKLAIRASQALEKQKQHESAATRLTALAIKEHTNNIASATHLRGCWNLAQVANTDVEKKSDFVDALRQHLKKWPTASSANQARIWLGGQLQTAGKWQSAFDIYTTIETNSPHFSRGMTLATYCAKKLIESSDDPNLATVAREVTNRFNTLVEKSAEGSNEQTAALLGLTEIGIRYGMIQPDMLVSQFENAVASTTDAKLKGSSSAWLLALTAGNPQRSEASKKLVEAIATDTMLLATAEQGMGNLLKPNEEPNETQKQIRLQIVDAALKLPLDESSKTAWLFKKSEALGDLGQSNEALSILVDLEKSQPNSAAIQIAIARMTSKVYFNSDPDKPLARWRKLSSRLKPHTANWYEAKFQVALMLEKTGKVPEAKKMLEYMKAVPPGWEKSDLKEEFEALLSRL